MIMFAMAAPHYMLSLNRLRLVALFSVLYAFCCMFLVHQYFLNTKKNGSGFDLYDMEHFDGQLEEGYFGRGDDLRYGDFPADVQNSQRRNFRPRIAIGGGITSKNLYNVTANNIGEQFQLFTIFLPSFCLTISHGFKYHFYLAYDRDDIIFNSHRLSTYFQREFYHQSRKMCPKSANISLHLIRCSHNGKPGWAQNDAMVEAYLDGMEYFYRINDDTKLVTANWTEKFVNMLSQYYSPSNVGVVGPNHSGGKLEILTHDFVHRTHLEIFGSYYPREFTDWWADDWMTLTYKPRHSAKLIRIVVNHTCSLGRRYDINYANKKKLQRTVAIGRRMVARYIEYKNAPSVQNVNLSKVISMSLYGRDPRHTWGAIRNAQLAPVIFPGWTLRVYYPQYDDTTPSTYLTNSWRVPFRTLQRLDELGVELVGVSWNQTRLSPDWWSYLVADDMDVDYFIIRHSDSRLGDDDFIAVEEWLKRTHYQPYSAENCPFKHPNLRMTMDGLWDGQPLVLRTHFNQDIITLAEDYIRTGAPFQTDVDVVKSASAEQNKFVSEVIWPAFFGNSSTCNNIVLPVETHLSAK